MANPFLPLSLSPLREKGRGKKYLESVVKGSERVPCNENGFGGADNADHGNRIRILARVSSAEQVATASANLLLAS